MEHSNQLLIKMDHEKQAKKFLESNFSLGNMYHLESLDQGTESPEKDTSLISSDLPTDWLIAESTRHSFTSSNIWDEAYEVFETNYHKGVSYVEPDLYHWSEEENEVEKTIQKDWEELEYIKDWQPEPDKSEFAWYLNDDRTELRKARHTDLGESHHKVRIAHLDTGFDPNHKSIPLYFNHSLQKNFIKGEDEHSAIDQESKGILKQPGHGTGTLGILAGNYIDHLTGYQDYIGAAPFADIIPIRIGKSVIQFKTSSVAKAIRYACNLQCNVISMSMGGMASKLWAERVNEAYESGIVMVTAAGNNFRGLPIKELVYPARFERVIAACGITYGNKPYYIRKNKLKVMQGCWGPEELMIYAMAAYTPNVPWAMLGTTDLFKKQGGGTSSATPQIAGAAALIMEKLADQAFDHPWQKAEAVRQMLLTTADLKGNQRLMIGNGVLQAYKALQTKINPQNLKAAPKAKVKAGILQLIFGGRFKNPAQRVEKEEMCETELEQLPYRDKEVGTLLADEELNLAQIPTKEKEKMKEAIIESSIISEQLRKQLKS